MKKIIYTIISVFALYAFPAFALSDNEYQELYKTSKYFKDADDELTQTWKSITEHLSPTDKKFILQEQRKWIKSIRDEEAKILMKSGIRKDCAYAEVIKKQISSLRAFAYNSNLSQEDKDAGRARSDDFYYDESEMPQECRK